MTPTTESTLRADCIYVIFSGTAYRVLQSVAKNRAKQRITKMLMVVFMRKKCIITMR